MNINEPVVLNPEGALIGSRSGAGKTYGKSILWGQVRADARRRVHELHSELRALHDEFHAEAPEELSEQHLAWNAALRAKARTYLRARDVARALGAFSGEESYDPTELRRWADQAGSGTSKTAPQLSTKMCEASESVGRYSDGVAKESRDGAARERVSRRHERLERRLWVARYEFFQVALMLGRERRPAPELTGAEREALERRYTKAHRRFTRLEAECRLGRAWQRLVAHDCLACGVDLGDCAELEARNAAVDEAAEGVSWWRQWRVSRRVAAPRTTWWNGRRRWA